MAATKKPAIEDPAAATRPLFDEAPYRMVIFAELNQHKTPVYLVAGIDGSPMRADKALRAAHKKFGGKCHFCKKPVAPDQLSIDHADPLADGGSRAIQNLLIACQPCNREKGRKPIEVYKPAAGREWLSALLEQVQDRLNRL
jgi:5-methylcytosine-specific restriction endonuclease McrA